MDSNPFQLDGKTAFAHDSYCVITLIAYYKHVLVFTSLRFCLFHCTVQMQMFSNA